MYKACKYLAQGQILIKSYSSDTKSLILYYAPGYLSLIPLFGLGLLIAGKRVESDTF
jgi:hypothetical protein